MFYEPIPPASICGFSGATGALLARQAFSPAAKHHLTKGIYECYVRVVPNADRNNVFRGISVLVRPRISAVCDCFLLTRSDFWH